MSAFLCSSYHISALVSWGYANGVIAAHNGNRWALDNPITCELAGEILYEANVAAIGARYGQEAAESDSTGSPWTFELITDLPTPGSIANGCACFAYQACEVADYPDSLAAAIVDAIKQAACTLPTSKRDAQWEIEPPSEERSTIRKAQS